MHAEAHDKAVEEWLDRHGIDTTPYHQQMEWIFRRVLGPKEDCTPEQRQKHLVERLG